MTQPDLPDVVRRLVHGHLPTVDHVTVLLATRADPDRVLDAAAIAPKVHVEVAVATRVLSDLAGSHLVERAGSGYRLSAAPEVRSAVDELARMYNTRPVTLIRAIYERPATSAQSFADAFRIRRPEE